MVKQCTKGHSDIKHHENEVWWCNTCEAYFMDN